MNEPYSPVLLQEEGLISLTVKRKTSHEDANEQPVLDLSQLTPATSVQRVGGAGEPGVLTIVNSARNGKRLSVPTTVLDEIGATDGISVFFGPETVYLSTPVEGAVVYAGKAQGTKVLFYSAGLVDEITNELGLDFSDGRVSLTFRQVEYQSTTAGNTVAVIML